MRVLSEEEKPCESQLVARCKAQVAQHERDVHLARLQNALCRNPVVAFEKLAKVIEIDVLGTCAVNRRFVGVEQVRLLQDALKFLAGRDAPLVRAGLCPIAAAFVGVGL